MTALRITLILKTNEGGRWVVPHIQEMLRRGHIVSVIIPPGEGRLTCLLRGLKIDIYSSKFDFTFRPTLATLRGLLALREQIVATRPDVLHYHLYASALASRICSLGLSVPRVHMVAGPLYLESPLIRFIERVLMWGDSVLIAGSQHTMEQYKALGMPPSRMHTIPYGVSTRTFRPPSEQERQEARSQLGVSSDTFVAIIVAYIYGPKRLVHSNSGIKGHDILLAAWQDFSAGKRDVQLFLVGGGFDAEGRAHRSHLMTTYPEGVNGVRWIDSVDNVSSHYWASDVSVSPSLSENHGAALEAGASGVARIVSDAGGLPETTSESSGWIVPRGDVDSLREALEEAYSEFRVGTLAKKADASRRDMLEKFDAGDSAYRVVQAIETAGGRHQPNIVSLFSEARLGTSRDGVLASVDAASGATAWNRYKNRIGGFRLAARVSELPGSAESVLDGLDVCRLPHYVGLRQFAFRLPWLLIECWKVVRGSSAIVVRLPGPLGFLAVFMATLARKPLFVEVVGDPETVLRDHPSRMIRRLSVPAKHVMRACVWSAKASRYVTSETLQAIYPPRSGTPSVTMSNVQLRNQDFRGTYSVPQNDRWRLVAIGSQETNYKGHDLAIEALSMLAERGYKCQLLLVGRGAVHEKLKAQARSLGVEHLVEFRDGFSQKHELWAILDNTDLFIHPSRSEGLPRVVIEAMARSKPVIGSRVGGIPELLSADQLVPPGNALALANRIQEFFDVPSKATDAASRNYETAQNFSYDKLEIIFEDWCNLISHLTR